MRLPMQTMIPTAGAFYARRKKSTCVVRLNALKAFGLMVYEFTVFPIVKAESS